MSSAQGARSPRQAALDAGELVQVPLPLLWEAIGRSFTPGSDGGIAMAKVLRVLSHVLLSRMDLEGATVRAVAFLEMAEALDGLGSSASEGGL